MAKHKVLIAEVSVRFRDIDAMGHVNNAVFFTYFEEARKVFLDEVLGIVAPSDYPFILAHMSCDYLKPIKMGDFPCVRTWIGDLGNKKFSFKYEIVDKSEQSTIYAKGESIMIFYDYTENKTVSIPPEFLEKISGYMA